MTARLHPCFPSLSSHRAPDSLRALTQGLSSVYFALSWKTPRPSPRLRTHLPIDAVAHRTIGFTGGLSTMPMLNAHLVPNRSAHLPPQSLMTSTYSAVKKRVWEALLDDWSRLFTLRAYYAHPTALHPQPFMGLSKFMARRILQMSAGKSYLGAHPSRRAPEADTSCPRCGLGPETFEQAILGCPFRQGARSRILHGVTDVGHEAPLWSSLPLLKRLATYISVTATAFPPTMVPATAPPSSPPFPLSPPILPRTVFGVFSLAKA